jgi:hypothetical protein
MPFEQIRQQRADRLRTECVIDRLRHSAALERQKIDRARWIFPWVHPGQRNAQRCIPHGSALSARVHQKVG